MGNLAAERYCDEGTTIETSTWLGSMAGQKPWNFVARYVNRLIKDD